MHLKEAVVFAILMENNDGILGKHPSYVMEKIDIVTRVLEPERLLDPENLEKFQAYCKKWKLG